MKTKLKKLDGSVVEIDAPAPRTKKSKQVVSRNTVQRVRLADGTVQEIAVVERRTKNADDRMTLRRRRKVEAAFVAADEGKVSSGGAASTTKTPKPKP